MKSYKQGRMQDFGKGLLGIHAKGGGSGAALGPMLKSLPRGLIGGSRRQPPGSATVKYDMFKARDVHTHTHALQNMFLSYL